MNAKMIKRFFVVSLSLIITSSLFAPSIRAAEVSVSASSSVLYEPTTGTFLCENAPDIQRPMASTTKIMTALVAIENSALDDRIEVDPAAVGVEGSSVYLKPHETLTMETLLYALLLESANDAAAAIAYAVGGSIEGFADMMNERAHSMGLVNTHFKNPHGLHDDEHYTTARELAIIAGTAMKNDTFRQIVSTKKKTLTLRDGTVSRVVCNHNRLLSLYGGCIGVKTGFTKKSGRCLVSAAERDGVLLIAVTLDAPNDWQDHMSLFDHGFSIFESKELAPLRSYTLTLPLSKHKKKKLVLSNALPLHVVLPHGETAELYAEYDIEKTKEPITDGAHYGTLYALYQGKRIASVPLIATEDIPLKKSHRGFFDRLFN